MPSSEQVISWIIAFGKSPRTQVYRSFSIAEIDSSTIANSPYIYRGKIIKGWFFDGTLVTEKTVTTLDIPYAIFSIDRANSTAIVEIVWHGRCGYGYYLSFDDAGNLIDARQTWIS